MNPSKNEYGKHYQYTSRLLHPYKYLNNMNLSVVIPTYKNKEMLLKNLQLNLPFLKECEIIIVNDFPSESIKKDLEQFAGITVIENKKNLGFGGAVNIGVNAATKDYVMLLNNDVILTDESYTKAFKHFEDDNNLFAVSFAQKEKDGSIVGKNKIYWQNGFFQHSKADNLDFGSNAWAEGGSCIVDKKKYIELEGFDLVFAPFYWEDVDLSYRAWKKGYTVLFDPNILVEHHHESTVGKYFDKSKVESIAFRNQLLFIWKNINDKQLISEHHRTIAKHLVKYILKGNWPYVKGKLHAFKKSADLPTEKINYKRTDAEILSLFNSSTAEDQEAKNK